jgi:hypothetical protein
VTTVDASADHEAFDVFNEAAAVQVRDTTRPPSG